MNKALEKKYIENHDNKVLKRNQFISKRKLFVQTKINLYGLFLWTVLTCFWVLCHYQAVVTFTFT